MSAFNPSEVRKAVSEFTPRHQPKFEHLLPAKDVIVELRQKRASFRAIAELLTQHCLPTGKTAVASLIPPLGNDKSKVLTLNLRNRMIFRSADEADAVQAADFIGKKRVVKRS